MHAKVTEQSLPDPKKGRLRSLIIEGDMSDNNSYITIMHTLFTRGEDQLIALRDIIEERQSQDRAYGPVSIRNNMTEAVWLELILSQSQPNGSGEDFRGQMVRIAAIALAAIEAHDGSKHRGDTSPGV